MELLFSTQYLRIFLHSTTHKTIELQWLDFVPSSDYRASIEEFMRLARQHHAQALVADNRLLRALRQADLSWSGDLVFKGLSEQGGRRCAIVESQDAMNRMGITALVAQVIPSTNLTSQFFTTVEEARAWATAPF
jgi:(p)ppGpp synthase/HD superfamily hydrolase